MATMEDLHSAIEKIMQAYCPIHGVDHLEICNHCMYDVICNGYFKDRWKENDGKICLGVCYCTCDD